MLYKIYVIKSANCDQVYIGSTQLPLKKRLSLHKSHYKRWIQKNSSYCTSFQIIQNGDCYIQLLEELECDCSKVFREIEGKYIKQTPNCVNRYIAGRSHKQYFEDRKNYFRKRVKCECGGYYQLIHKTDHEKSARHKKYVDEKTWKVDQKRFDDPRAVFSDAEPIKSLDSDEE